MSWFNGLFRRDSQVVLNEGSVERHKNELQLNRDENETFSASETLSDDEACSYIEIEELRELRRKQLKDLINKIRLLEENIPIQEKYLEEKKRKKLLLEYKCKKIRLNLDQYAITDSTSEDKYKKIYSFLNEDVPELFDSLQRKIMNVENKLNRLNNTLQKMRIEKIEVEFHYARLYTEGELQEMGDSNRILDEILSKYDPYYENNSDLDKLIEDTEKFDCIPLRTF